MNEEANENLNENEKKSCPAPAGEIPPEEKVQDDEAEPVENDSTGEIKIDKKEHVLERIENYRHEFHMFNRKRVKAGIRCLLTVPMVFLVLLLMTGGDRIIFLVLWVISMFLISGYLIYLEYMDFKVDKLVAAITGRAIDELHAETAADAVGDDKVTAKDDMVTEETRDEEHS